jgi:hypothetical protein
MKAHEAEDYVQLAGDFLVKQLPTGAWFKLEDRVGIPYRERYNLVGEVRLLYTAASKARLGLFCNRLLGDCVKERGQKKSIRAMGLQVGLGCRAQRWSLNPCQKAHRGLLISGI